ncbi:MAG TPA: TonB-dependent receptor [Mucilaginibacter sp.]|nr:TonB-dependent receptor [Mucilaginibacter sp.]
MLFRSLSKASYIIVLCFFFLPVFGQNIKPKAGDTTDITDSTVVHRDPIMVKSYTGRQFNQGAIFNPVDKLSGKMPGLTITHPGGDPNQVASISIRGQASLFGNTSPLFVVDGVMLDNCAQFQNIPPDEIASCTILKDASATAIYGMRGANGVIIVTTKKGKKGQPVVSYDGLVAAASQSKYYDLLNASEYRTAIGGNASFYDKGANTNWQKAIARTAIQQQNSLSVSGGSNTITYLGGVDYQDQQGIIQNNGKKQLGLRFSGELKALADKLDVKAGIQYVNTKRELTDYANFSYVFNDPPTYPVKNPDGSYYAFSDFDLANPVEHINQEALGDKEHLTLINGSVDYSIIRDLKIGLLASVDMNKMHSSGYIPAFPVEGDVSLSGTANENTHLYNANIHINYDKTLGKSTLNLLAAFEYGDHSYYSDYAFSSGSKGFYNQEYKLTSFIAQAAYNYNDLFFATVTLREDQSAVFRPDQHGYFPSLSLAYKFKNDILANADWINDMKLRAGYGLTGNSTDQLGNPMPRWEEMHGANIGLDFSLFNGTLSGDINYFNNQTKDLLIPYPVPSPPFVNSTLLANAGSLTNKGLEVYLSGQIISGKKLNWTVDGQITFITTNVGDLFGQHAFNGQTYNLSTTQVPVGYAEGRGLSSGPIEFFKTGYSPYVFYLPHYTGVDAEGNQTFDGKTIQQNANPQGHYIDPAPKFNYGVTNSFDYGNWNLSFALRGVYGQKIFNNTLLNIETITRLPGNNVTKEALTNGIKDAPVASDLWLEGASFLRMDNIALGYSFRNVSFANSLRVFIAANNLFVITGYRGLDPEIQTIRGTGGNLLFNGNLNGSTNQPYIDTNYSGQAYYPVARTFSLGVNISLK